MRRICPYCGHEVEITWRLIGADKDCVFDAAFYLHLLNFEVRFEDDVFDLCLENTHARTTSRGG